MAELIKLSCKNCGAPLEVNLDKEIFFCMYCGQKMYLEKYSQVDSGYEFEKGRVKYQRELENLEKRITETGKRITYIDTEIESMGYGIGNLGLWVVVAGIIIMFIAFVVGLLLIVLGVFLAVRGFAHRKEEEKKLQAEKERLICEMAQLMEQRDNFQLS